MKKKICIVLCLGCIGTVSVVGCSNKNFDSKVTGEPYSGDYNIVMSHISHIREKIEDDPSHPVYIQTVWGVGYKFNEKMCE